MDGVMPASRLLLLPPSSLALLPALQPPRDALDHARGFSRNRSMIGGDARWSGARLASRRPPSSIHNRY